MDRKGIVVAVAGGLVLLSALALVGEQVGLFSILPTNALVGSYPGGVYLLPTNQLLQPWGEQARITGRPVDLALNPAGNLLAVLNSKSVLVLDAASGTRTASIESRSTSYAGIAFRPGTRELWASEARRRGPDHILVASLEDSGAVSSVERIQFEGHPVPVGIAFSSDGAKAYVALSRNNTLAIIDTSSRTVQKEIPVGIAPHAVVVSEKHSKVYISNRGGRRPAPGDTVAPTSGTTVKSDPGSGFAVSGTVSVIDIRTQQVTEIEVGLAPSGMALSPDGKTLAVANGHSDSVSLIDLERLRRSGIRIPVWPEDSFGSQPVALAFSPDGRSLYVACGGNNAIAVAERKNGTWKVAGAMPTGWFPSAVAVDGQGNLRVINIKGTGNTATPGGAYLATAYEGMLLKIPAQAPPRLAAGTREVRASNTPGFAPSGGVEDLSSLGIRHVFFIIKENRTYDQVFGDLPRGNADPKLVMYGREVTPNHHALAEQFVLLDNFYVSSAISFDGHHWLMQAFVSDYVQRAFAASPRGYAWDMSDALTLSPTGFFWERAGKPVSVRVFGEFCLPARWDPATQSAVDIDERDLKDWGDYWRLYKEGGWEDAVACSAAGVPALKDLMEPRYPVNETNIPDQLRAEVFFRELAEREKSGAMAAINIITLTADHTNGTRPGSPTPRAMVADNDLALGRIVEGISKSRFWAQSLILVVEDDAQDGLDHVDGHRTVALAIGPHIRRDALDSNHYTQLSMVRTIQEIFRIPPRTHYLKSARAMHSVFTTAPDLTPYWCLPSNIPLDEMNPPLAALAGRKLWAARQSLAMNWLDVDDVPSDVLNKILWWDSKGYDKPYPTLAKR